MPPLDPLVVEEALGGGCAHEWRAAEATQDPREVVDYLARSVHRGEWAYVEDAALALLGLIGSDQP